MAAKQGAKGGSKKQAAKTQGKAAVKKSVGARPAKPARKLVVKMKGAAARAPREKKNLLPAINVGAHIFVPLQEKVEDKEKEALLSRFLTTVKEMPRVSLKDPGIRHLDPKLGDMIKITRKSPTAGTSIYYRVVTNV